MSKLINFDTEVRTKLKKGIDILANSVKVTLGPKGRNVIIEQPYGAPHITKDGVSVAKEIELEDPFENAGAQLVKSVASKTCDDAGDGTTTSTVLAQAIVSEGIKNLEAGANPVDLKKGIDIAVKEVVNYINTVSIKVEDDFDKIEQVATISANNDQEIGKLIVDAFKKVSKDGVITIEEAKSADTTISIVEGMQLDRGYLSPYFATDREKMECEFEKAYILIYKGKLTNIKDILPILETIAKYNASLLIIAEDFDSEALTTLVVNRLQNGLKLCAIKTPGFGDQKRDILEDIAILTGGAVISEELGMTLNKATFEMLGSCDKLIVTKNNTTIINGNGDSNDVNNRIEELRNAIKTSNNPVEKDRLQERLAKLSGGVAVLYIGANSEVEMKEKKDRVEDALCATRAAIEEGIVPGGGTTYLKAFSKVFDLYHKETSEDVKNGIKIIAKSLDKPLYTIVQNSGKDPGYIVEEVRNITIPNWGYNAATSNYEDMLKSGIIDPAKVTRVALENAASVASLVLTAGCVICNKLETNA